MIELLSDPAVWAAFATLTVMEIVLGIDNIVFISVLVARLPKEQADRARQLGLALALIFRIALLLVISWVIGLDGHLFELFGHSYSWKDLILLGGGPWGSAGARDVPTLRAEVRLVEACLEKGTPVVGIGLGAQILAIAAGGKSEPAPLARASITAARNAKSSTVGSLSTRVARASGAGST